MCVLTTWRYWFTGINDNDSCRQITQGDMMTECINIKDEMEARTKLPELIKTACTNCICSMEQIIVKVQPSVPNLKVNESEILKAFDELNEYYRNELNCSTRCKGIMTLRNEDLYELGDKHKYTYESGYASNWFGSKRVEYTIVYLHDLLKTTYLSGYTYIESEHFDSFRRLLLSKAKELTTKTGIVESPASIPSNLHYLLNGVGFVVGNNLYVCGEDYAYYGTKLLGKLKE